jgi:hypothetical protein
VVGSQDTDIITSIDEIVDSLFSVLVTMGVVPIIRSPRNNAAEMVAQKLDQKLRDHLKVRLHSPDARPRLTPWKGCHFVAPLVLSASPLIDFFLFGGQNTRNSLFTDASHGSVSFQRPGMVTQVNTPLRLLPARLHAMLLDSLCSHSTFSGSDMWPGDMPLLFCGRSACDPGP